MAINDEPLGSQSPAVLYKNAEVLDHFINDPDNDSFPDRFGILRETITGIYKRINQLANQLQIGAVIYDTVDDGLSGSTDGQYFSVVDPDSDGMLILYKNVSGAAQEIKRYPSSELIESIFSAGLSLGLVVDDDGESFHSAVIDEVTQKIIAGVGKRGSFVFGDIKLTQTDGEWRLSDGAGRTWLRYKDGAAYFFDMKISFNDSGIITINDPTGRTLFRLSKTGSVYIGKLMNSLEDSGSSSVYDIAAITPAGQWQMADVNHINYYGQSLSRGINTGAAISLTQPYNNIMIASGVLSRPGDSGYDPSATVPLTEQTQESPTCGTINGISRRFADRYSGFAAPVFIGSSSGEGQRGVDDLAAGGEGFFEKTLQLFRDVKSTLNAAGKTYAVTAYPWVQGEHDQGMASYLYSQHLAQLKQDLDNGVISITGQKFLPLMPMYQTCAHRRYSRKKMNLSQAQLSLARQYPDFVMATPVYICEHASDTIHLSPEGSWLLGEYIGRATFQTIFTNEKWLPLMPRFVEWSDTQIVIGGWNPRGDGLVIDNALCADTWNGGLDLFTANDVLIDIISSVSVTDKTTITVTLSEPAPAGALLCCGRGRDSAMGPGNGGPLTGPRTNIRDNQGDYDTATSPLGNTFALHNASVLWQYSRKDGFNAI